MNLLALLPPIEYKFFCRAFYRAIYRDTPIANSWDSAAPAWGLFDEVTDERALKIELDQFYDGETDDWSLIELIAWVDESHYDEVDELLAAYRIPLMSWDLTRFRTLMARYDDSRPSHLSLPTNRFFLGIRALDFHYQGLWHPNELILKYLIDQLFDHFLFIYEEKG